MPKRKSTASGSTTATRSSKRATRATTAKLFSEIPERKDITYDELDPDLEVSYVGEYKFPDPPPRPARKSCTPPPDVIHDLSQVPPGWSDEEPDLDDDDIDGQIERCKERIAEKIMPLIFEDRLKKLEKVKEGHEKLREEFPNLSLKIAQRIVQLRRMLKWLEDQKDPHGLVKSVRGVIAEYESGNLEMHPGLVTYWVDGEQISMPRPFQVDEFLVISEKYKDQGLWVEEGYTPVKRAQMGLRVASAPYPSTHLRKNKFRVAVRLLNQALPPGGNPIHLHLDFIDDTGCDFMTMRESDIPLLQIHCLAVGRPAPAPPLRRLVELQTIEGHGKFFYCRYFEVALFDGNREALVDWTLVPVAIIDDVTQVTNPLRVIGPWLRYKVFTATTPNNKGALYLFPTKSLITKPDPLGLPIAQPKPLRRLLYRFP